MKIGILGCRGIPNAYGGFEQFAEYLSKGLVERGHDVYVYNSHKHPYQKKEWQGVNIIHCYDPEYKIGTMGQFIYDFNCIKDSHKRNYDIILQLGYTSSSIWGNLLPKEATIITNMDGLEWKRSKYSKKVQHFLQWAEKRAVETSDYLVADSLGIQTYLKKKYTVNAVYIPYGAHLFITPDEQILQHYQVKEYNYFMLIARLVPENNIEPILKGFADASSTAPFLVVGDHTTKYGTYLKKQFASNHNIRFLGGIYDLTHLNNLRCFSSLYFHGHSVGGTNPSLLEAMASKALICANKNAFNQAILGKDAFYFENDRDITTIINSFSEANNITKIDANYDKITALYQWERIIDTYERYLLAAHQQSTDQPITESFVLKLEKSMSINILKKYHDSN